MGYKAKRDGDFWTIMGVPIFAEVPEGVKGAPFDIDSEWMKKTLANHKVRRKEGYTPPLNFEHHGVGDNVFKAGQWELRRVGNVTIGGEKKAALFADLTKLPDHVFGAIMRNEWPYRSVEILEYETHEIESLSLLDDDTPFHKFELLNEDTIDVEEEAPLDRDLVSVGPVAFALRDGGGCRALFHFREKEDRSMNITVRGNPTDGFRLFDEAGKPVTTVSQAAKVTIEPDEGWAFENDDDKDDKDTLPTTIAALKALLKKAGAKLKKMQEDDGEEEEPKPSEPDEDKEKAKKAKAKMSASPEFVARFDALDAKVEKMERKEKAGELAEKAVGELTTGGWHVSARIRDSIKSYASRGDRKGLKTYMDTVKSCVPKDGPETLGDETEDDEPRLLHTYETRGPKQFEIAKKANAQFDELAEAGYRVNSDPERKRFIDFKLREAGHAPAKEA